MSDTGQQDESVSADKTETKDEEKKDPVQTALKDLSKTIDTLVKGLPEKEAAGEPAGSGDQALVNLVGYHALNRAAGDIADAINGGQETCPELKDATVLIVERSDLAAWQQSYRVVWERLSLLEDQMTQAVSGRTTKMSFLAGLGAAAVAAAPLIGNVAEIAVGIGKCIAYFRPTISMRSAPITLGTGELAAAVGGRLQTRSRSVRLFRHQWVESPSKLAGKFALVNTLAAKLANAESQRAPALREFMPAGEAPVVPAARPDSAADEDETPAPYTSIEVKALLKQVEAAVNELATQTSLLRDAFSWDLLMALKNGKKYTHLLCLDLASPQGTTVTDKGWVRDHLVSIAGCAVTFSVIDQDLTVCLSSMVPVMYRFHYTPGSDDEGGTIAAVKVEEEAKPVYF
jgi:hypothetical protein